MLDDVQQFNIGSAHVFVAQFDEDVEVRPVEPPLRQHVIEQSFNLLYRQQRYFVWQLLNYALTQLTGKGVGELSFVVDDKGKWSCNGGVNFSLSHCGRVVAVAVSSTPIGVDVELLDAKRFGERLARRILTENERAVYDNTAQAEQFRVLAEFWTKKESLFKRDGGETFVPKDIDTTLDDTHCQTVRIGSGDYVVAVAN